MTMRNTIAERLFDQSTDAGPDGYVSLPDYDARPVNRPTLHPAISSRKAQRRFSLGFLAGSERSELDRVIQSRDLQAWKSLFKLEDAGPEIDVYFSDVPYGRKENPDGEQYATFTCELIDAANEFTTANGGAIPIDKTQEFLEHLQAKAIIPFVQTLTRLETGNHLLYQGGSHTDAPYGRWTALGTVIPVRHEDGELENYYLEQAILAFSRMQAGQRIPSQTPAHGHAANVGYVCAKIPHTRRAIALPAALHENLYDVRVLKTGSPLVGADGRICQHGLGSTGIDFNKLTLEKIDEEVTVFGDEPTAVTSVAATQQQAIMDCIQRPHSVLPIMDASESTPLMMGTYLGPKAQVTVFPDSRVNKDCK